MPRPVLNEERGTCQGLASGQVGLGFSSCAGDSKHLTVRFWEGVGTFMKNLTFMELVFPTGILLLLGVTCRDALLGRSDAGGK